MDAQSKFDRIGDALAENQGRRVALMARAVGCRDARRKALLKEQVVALRLEADRLVAMMGEE